MIRRSMMCFGVLVLATGDLMAQEPDSTLGVELTYAVGADLSFLKSAEDRGVQFKEDGVVRPGLDIFRDHGYDWIRLRLFHSPTELPNDLEYTISLAQEAKARGFRFLLDYHYADGWADPGKQPTPAAWDTTSIEVLVDSVYAWTRNTIRAFREAGVMPEMVQIGNEVRNGMMWPLGRLPENWDNFASLLGVWVCHGGSQNDGWLRIQRTRTEPYPCTSFGSQTLPPGVYLRKLASRTKNFIARTY